MKYALSILVAVMALLTLNSCDGRSRYHTHHHTTHAKHIAVHKPLKAHVEIPKKRKAIEIKPYHDNVYVRQNGSNWDFIEVVSDVLDAVADAAESSHDTVKIAKVETTPFGPNPSKFNSLGECAKGIRFVIGKPEKDELEDNEEVELPGVIEAEDGKAITEAEEENEAIDAENAEAEADNAAADAEAAAADAADAAADAASDAAADAADAGGAGDGGSGGGGDGGGSGGDGGGAGDGGGGGD